MPLGCCHGVVTRGNAESVCMVCFLWGDIGVGLSSGQRTRQYPAAREPAYRPPPRPLSRSSARDITVTLPGGASGAGQGGGSGTPEGGRRKAEGGRRKAGIRGGGR